MFAQFISVSPIASFHSSATRRNANKCSDRCHRAVVLISEIKERVLWLRCEAWMKLKLSFEENLSIPINIPRICDTFSVAMQISEAKPLRVQSRSEIIYYARDVRRSRVCLRNAGVPWRRSPRASLSARKIVFRKTPGVDSRCLRPGTQLSKSQNAIGSNLFVTLKSVRVFMLDNW